MGFLLQLQYVCGSVFLVFFCNLWIGRLLRKKSSMKQYTEAPQPSGALPVIGHLHLLKGPKPLAQVLGDMADKCGPVFMLRLGQRRMLVVNNEEGARDCLSTNDKALASRPAYAAGRHMGYDNAVLGFAPYGPYWRLMRKISTIELLSNTRLEMLKHVRSMEVDMFMKELHGMWVKNKQRPIKVDMKQLLGDLAYNIIVNMVAGKRYFGSTVYASDEALRFRRAVTQFFKLLTAFVPSDMFPFLKWVYVNGNETAMRSAAQDMDSLMSNLIEEHRQRRTSQKANDDCDFIDVMLSTMEDVQHPEMDPDKAIKATSLAMIFGGTDNTIKSMVHTLAALLDNTHVLEKVQEELDAVVGKNRLVEESDIKNLVYLQAVIKEAFRLYPAATVIVPHVAIEDCQIQGYHIPVGTQVLVNIWKLQRDPNAWSDPYRFKPERFLSRSSIDVRGQHFELIPFGSGRRACPGISFSLQVMHLTLARLIQGFKFQVRGNAPSNRYLAPDIPNLSSLEVMLAPRLSPGLFI
ncbi:cytochrome P450 CYP82D47-like [Asparagus officinalis]|uniref:cytochrome P450 CYP82D47-like n=1 Tax=Asparagus officinalis TaxID=4686 RepID=UPI00098E1A0A|nr:cytochrome P450 CYP82D47-like [Asparagus officinalis]